MSKAKNSWRFEWLDDNRNTIRALFWCKFYAPEAICKDIQHGVALGYLQEVDCWAIARASKELREQVGF